MTNVVRVNNNVVRANNIVVFGGTIVSDYKSSHLQGLASVLPKDPKQFPRDVYFLLNEKKKYPVKWLTLWQDDSEIGVSIMEQAESDLLTKTEYRVRDWLLGTIGVGNFCYVNQSEMARKLNIERATASRAIKRLIELNILIPGPKSGKNNTYQISPAFCFFGKIKDGVKERREVIKTEKAKIIDFKNK